MDNNDQKQDQNNTDTTRIQNEPLSSTQVDSRPLKINVVEGGDSETSGTVMPAENPVGVVDTGSEVATQPEQTQPNVESGLTDASGSEQSFMTDSADQPTEQVVNGADLFKSEDNVQQNNIMPSPTPAMPGNPKKSTAPKTVVIIAIVIGLALVALSVFAYTNTQDDKDKVNNEQTSETTESQPTVSGEDVENAAKDLDSELSKTNDSTEIPTEESVSDTTLGL